MSNTSISLEQLRQAIALKEQIASLGIELDAIFGGTAVTPLTLTGEAAPAKTGRGGSRTMSSEGRARIAAAQKARWAKFHKSQGPVIGSAAPKKKRNISPEGRARLSAAVKARWAKFRKGKRK